MNQDGSMIDTIYYQFRTTTSHERKEIKNVTYIISETSFQHHMGNNNIN